VAKKMGLPINKLIVATNKNDILQRVINTGEYKPDTVKSTITPSMDIQVASNFERFLFDLLDRSPKLTYEKMNNLKNLGKIYVNEEQLANAQTLFASRKATMNDVNKTTLNVYKKNSYLLDPHTAIGLFASRELLNINENNFILGTAHPVKFMQTVEEAISDKLNLQDGYKDLFNEDENIISLDNDADLVKNEILSKN
jgi:threonine synthase